MMKEEHGQALPLALFALSIGTLVISPFLSHAGSSLTGSRIYGQAISEQYSCDAGVEWALWKLKENPILTTSTVYDSASLEPFPDEVNDSSFPVTELRFVENAGATETITPDWEDGEGEHNYYFQTSDEGSITVVLANITASKPVIVELSHVPGQPDYEFRGDGPYTAEFEIDSAGAYTILVTLPKENKYGPLEPGAITIAITYPVTSYDIRARKGDRTITARITASYIETRVISWQIE